MRTLSRQRINDGSTVKVRISNAYLNFNIYLKYIYGYYWNLMKKNVLNFIYKCALKMLK